MAAFSFQHHPFLLDSVILPNTTIKMSGLLGEGDMNSACFSYTPSAALPHNAIDLKTHDISRKVLVGENQEDCRNEIGVIESQKTCSSSIVVEQVCGGDQDHQKKRAMDKKRKNRDGSAQSKDPKEVRGKKQKNCSTNLKGTEDLKPKADKKNEKKISEEPPTGYIHVRARRGQATDSHSLAERVRREKISDRMKLLQNLVPGCDKVTGKALMLDEIINYVQSLQNQVEFLSMKLASVNPMVYTFGVDVDDCMTKSEKLGSLNSPMSSLQQSGHTQPTVFLDTITTFPTTNDYTLPENAVSGYLHGQRPNAFSQDHDNLVWDVDGQRQSFTTLTGFNMCSF